MQTSPDQARSVLLQAPQITYALFQALIIMKVITPATIQQVLRSAVQPQQQQMFAASQPMPSQYQQPLPQQQQFMAAGIPSPATPMVQQTVPTGSALDLNSLPPDQRVILLHFPLNDYFRLLLYKLCNYLTLKSKLFLRCNDSKF